MLELVPWTRSWWVSSYPTSFMEDHRPSSHMQFFLKLAVLTQVCLPMGAGAGAEESPWTLLPTHKADRCGALFFPSEAQWLNPGDVNQGLLGFVSLSATLHPCEEPSGNNGCGGFHSSSRIQTRECLHFGNTEKETSPFTFYQKESS